MSNAVKFKQTKVKVAGVEYTLQKIPFKFYLDITDKNTGKDGKLEKAGYIGELFKHVVVSPKVSFDDFNENFSAGFELVGEIESFLNSKPESKSVKTESEE